MKQQEMRFGDDVDRHMLDPISLNDEGPVIAGLFADALREG